MVLLSAVPRMNGMKNGDLILRRDGRRQILRDNFVRKTLDNSRELWYN